MIRKNTWYDKKNTNTIQTYELSNLIEPNLGSITFFFIWEMLIKNLFKYKLKWYLNKEKCN